jgi:hypothetical protein
MTSAKAALAPMAEIDQILFASRKFGPKRRANLRERKALQFWHFVENDADSTVFK